MTAHKYIVGNWKMYGVPGQAATLATSVRDHAVRQASANVILCPPAPLLSEVAAVLKGSHVQLGGQDCHAQAEGAFTGDISAPMLKSLGCTHVLVGHSERRTYHKESDEDVRKKALSASQSGLVPIICIGETSAERKGGKAESVVARQLAESLPEAADSGNFMLAYEPVWAIGSGETPTDSDIERMHTHIIGIVAERTKLKRERIKVLYGGSVKAANASEILAIAGVAGVLVGGASLKADEFCRIIDAAK